MKFDPEARRAARPVIAYDEALPVNLRRAEIAEAIVKHQVVVICGETGSGKTTQLPKICLELGRGLNGLIGHTQPRRIAARATATRISQELKSELGRHVGFKIRFTDKVTPSSYIKLMTDGILLAETQTDPLLRQYDTILIDEAHERSLNIDFLLGYLKQLLPKRRDLKSHRHLGHAGCRALLEAFRRAPRDRGLGPALSDRDALPALRREEGQ
jgi:ATP-dependent helicase HrpA